MILKYIYWKCNIINILIYVAEMQLTRIWNRRKLGSSCALKISSQSFRGVNILKVDESGIRLDKFLRKKVDNPMSHIFRSIRKKEIKVTFASGKRVPKSNKNDFKLDTNMHVSLFNKNFVKYLKTLKKNSNYYDEFAKSCDWYYGCGL